jgi:chemotaxis protein CheD
MKRIVGMADMCISSERDDLLMTYALGTCLGIAVYDPISQIGGMLHVMLPASIVNPAKAEANPCMFVDTGFPALVQKVCAAGAASNRLRVKVAGGSARQTEGEDRFAIGQRNYVMLRKVLWKYGLLVDSEDVGGELPRNMFLEIGSGRVWLNCMGRDIDL